MRLWEIFAEILSLYCLCFVASCPVSTKRAYMDHTVANTTINPQEKVRRYLDEVVALSGGNHGIIVMKNMSKPRPYFPATIRPDDIVIRMSQGIDIVLQCRSIGTGPLSPTPLIRFNGKLLNFTHAFLNDWREKTYRCCNPESRFKAPPADSMQVIKPKDYNTTGHFQIKLTEFSHSHAGTYECLRADGNNFTVTQRFVISPRLFPNQVLDPPMGNVTAKVGEEASLRCSVRYNNNPLLHWEYGRRFIWRKDQHLLFATGIPAFKEAEIGGAMHSGTSADCHCHSTLVFNKVTKGDAGQYQCFFKIDDVFDEWVMGYGYLHVVE
ncbi:uncharacterized protein LOC129600573 [Paramacrobiotus metropolitanus]|uniref:uncharacterized protein LOC129600573 n=1 Tax=Paramacrobiotus metropolitanus TaxID=2943436 RepID=UPI0024462D88|nr:uncharacterized protein LOC129600573 [Paramacrobiotus metropolitanus]